MWDDCNEKSRETSWWDSEPEKLWLFIKSWIENVDREKKRMISSKHATEYIYTPVKYAVK